MNEKKIAIEKIKNINYLKLNWKVMRKLYNNSTCSEKRCPRLLPCG